MKKKILIIVLGIIICSVIGLWFAAPSIARWYILDRYPYITSVGEIKINKDEIEIQQIIVNKDNIEGILSTVTFDYDTTIIIEGGFLLVDLNQGRPKAENTGNTKKYTIIARKLNVNVKVKDYLVKLSDVAYNDPSIQGEDEVSFKEATAEIPKLKDVRIYSGSYDLTNKILLLGSVHFGFELPIKIPTIENKQLVNANSISIDLPRKEIKAMELSLSDVDSEYPHTVLKKPGIKYSNKILTATAQELNTMHPWLKRSKDEPFILNSFAVTAPLSLIENRTGNIKLTHKEIEMEIDVDTLGIKTNQAPCTSWLSLTSGLEFVKYEDVSGKFGFDIAIRPEPKIKVQSTCKVDCKADFIAALKKEFTYTAYHADGTPFERTIGRRTKEWAPLIGVPPWISQGFILFEDPWFERHKGYQNSAFLNSLKANLKAQKFVRGGSTIPMQLAKNLWLGRNKTIDRKFQEVILATFLEGCFLKHEILELYVNVVEFGPDVYGLRDASRYYFKKEIGFLDPIEAFYLARILPRPHTATPPDKGGLEHVKKLLAKMIKTGYIPKHLVLEQDIAFYIGYQDDTIDTAGTKESDLPNFEQGED